MCLSQAEIILSISLLQSSFSLNLFTKECFETIDSSFLQNEITLSFVSNISSSAVKLIVALSLLKSSELIKSTDIYFQNTLFWPLTSGLRTTKRIPGSNVVFVAINAGKARLCNEYFNIPSFSM